MFNYQKFALLIPMALATILLNVAYVLPVEAITQQLQLKGDRGYQVEAIFSYDWASATEITEQGRGTTDTVDYLKVSFYDPSGSVIASYDNIMDGIAYGNYFEFHYDPLLHKILGEVDLGGESAGEMYLKGNAADKLSLILVDPSGKEKVVDQLSVINR
ncbi:MAG: hypothetical protein AAF383_07850 [Cyanobacteria bacterium P01_A01_bin.83]